MKPSRFAFQAGFTLIELIMVIVMLGVLAVFAAPRILNTGDFYARGFHDETQAYLRYAQKTAIAQRRTICVTFTSTSVSLGIASAEATPNCATAGTLTGPKGDSPPTVNARSGVSYVSPPTSFNFDGLGQPITAAGSAQATQVIQVSGVSKSITVETATGYVHE